MEGVKQIMIGNMRRGTGPEVKPDDQDAADSLRLESITPRFGVHLAKPAARVGEE
jgi:hypothetical protein